MDIPLYFHTGSRQASLGIRTKINGLTNKLHPFARVSGLIKLCCWHTGVESSRMISTCLLLYHFDASFANAKILLHVWFLMQQRTTGGQGNAWDKIYTWVHYVIHTDFYRNQPYRLASNNSLMKGKIFYVMGRLSIVYNFYNFDSYLLLI